MRHRRGGCQCLERACHCFHDGIRSHSAVLSGTRSEPTASDCCALSYVVVKATCVFQLDEIRSVVEVAFATLACGFGN